MLVCISRFIWWLRFVFFFFIFFFRESQTESWAEEQHGTEDYYLF